MPFVSKKEFRSFYTNLPYPGPQEESAMYTYKTRGVCSRAIEFDVENEKITACRFIGGCAGNTQGVGAKPQAQKAK